MEPRLRTPVWLAALAIAVLQVVGSFGAADSQPERRALDVVAVALVLIGPAALAMRDRWPDEKARSEAAAMIADDPGRAEGYLARSFIRLAQERRNDAFHDALQAFERSRSAIARDAAVDGLVRSGIDPCRHKRELDETRVSAVDGTRAARELDRLRKTYCDFSEDMW